MNEIRERKSGKMNTRRGTSSKLEASPATGPIEGHREATAFHVGFCGNPLERYQQFSMDMIVDVS